MAYNEWGPSFSQDTQVLGRWWANVNSLPVDLFWELMNKYFHYILFLNSEMAQVDEIHSQGRKEQLKLIVIFMHMYDMAQVSAGMIMAIFIWNHMTTEEDFCMSHFNSCSVTSNSIPYFWLGHRTASLLFPQWDITVAADGLVPFGR